MSRTFCSDIGGPTTALALSKQSELVAVIGRSIFKIYSIGENQFDEVTKIRVLKTVNPSFNDVAWNQVDENILASASSNGSIVIWNLSTPGYSKMDQIFEDHKRTVNKIRFHDEEVSLLVSGSQDSIKLFDLRANEAVISFSGLTESVRDLKFCPLRPNTFLAVLDNGYIQLYDIRKKDRYEYSFPGHNGPILACDWQPESNNTFVTAGRDMSIKVWSIDNQTSSLQHCIPTMESVSKVEWSYENTNHIASCSLKRDFSINVWDVNRPYIATARFTEPKEVTIGLAWRRGKENIISCSRDGLLYQFSMVGAHRPVEHANPVGIAINPDGDIALALGNGLIRSNHQVNMITDSNVVGSKGPRNSTASPSKFLLVSSSAFQRTASNLLRRQSSTSSSSVPKSRISNRSQLDVYKCIEMNWFVKTAQGYQLSNRPLADLCDHNAQVCANLKRFQVCQTWKILKLFYANIQCGNTSNTSQLNTNYNTNHTTPSRGSHHLQLVNVGADDISINSQATFKSDISCISKNHSSWKFNSNNPRSILNDAVVDDKIFSQHHSVMRNMSKEDEEEASSNSDQSSSEDWLSTDTLSYEAFQPKHEIVGGGVNKLVDMKVDRSESTSPSMSNFGDDDYHIRQNDRLQAVASGNSLIAPLANLGIHLDDETNIRSINATNNQQLKFYEMIADVIADVIKCHVENSDVQSAVSILIVLGDRIKSIVDERIPEVDRESWYHSYIDLLSKFQLWNVMAQVINLSPLQDINSINQTSTTIYTTCGSCNYPLNGKVSWICERCKTKPSECSICHGVVSGLMSWCQGCYHGGHLTHMSEWFSKFDYCPTGCGHMCETGQWRQNDY